jgi:chaperonin cofactor prefoldin
MGDVHSQVSAELLAEKDEVIRELRGTIEIMELKIKKMEQLIQLKDEKIQTLTSKLSEASINS